MQKTKILLGIIATLVIAFIGFRIFQQEVIADYIRPIILPLVTLYYIIEGYNRKSYFFLFLAVYAFADLFGFFNQMAEESELVDSLMYFGCNTLYILAYIFLIMEVYQSMNLSKILSRFLVHIVILFLLDIYCVILVSEVAIKSENLVTIYDHIIEIAYNSVIMIMLTVTLINYLYRDSKKAMNLLLGALCIVFSEVFQVAYFYVSEINVLSIAYSVLLVVAFTFFYIQVKMSYGNNEVTLSSPPIEEAKA
ncbi:MAG: hypothetical protein KJO77_08485 [Bacteroidia bacterium]|nr:hypothetical protein [Bacteroidia bacterium]NND52592.1 hypothetical protein [Flavobacteriaceae bacterium]